LQNAALDRRGVDARLGEQGRRDGAVRQRLRSETVEACSYRTHAPPSGVGREKRARRSRSMSRISPSGRRVDAGESMPGARRSSARGAECRVPPPCPSSRVAVTRTF
jgi:hypothetical protein